MIPYYLLILLIYLFALLIAPLTLLPNASLPATFATGLIAGQDLGMIWSVAPYTFTALIAAIVVVVGVETHIFSYKAIRWIYQKIPGIN